MPIPKEWKERLRRARDWVRTRVPFGLRTVLGLLLIVGGVFGFLPILGFWMIPLGLAVIAIDIDVLWKWLNGRH
ncbi:hypothetical protein AB2B41_04555 [Marimonas sp. MJW-29]|uniref:Transmembrane protein (PGPGW) n=1 Tax=Sulfitobacter sediminis TaxID=3234186 RepID=A0ABV3RJZ9_9RHOB